MIHDYPPSEAAAIEERRAIRWAIALVLGAFALGALAAIALAGCAALPSPSQQAVVASYEAEQLACVVEAGTRLDADRCRCAVHERYGRPCATVSLDGGTR